VEVTNVSVYPVEEGNERLLAFCSVVFDSEFVVHNLRLIDAESRVIVAMPNEEFKGEYRDIAHPISNNCRQKIRNTVIREYNGKVEEDEEIDIQEGYPSSDDE